MNNKITPKKYQEVGQIMGINVNSSMHAELLTRVNDFVSHSRKFCIVTPNPELILMAQKNNLLKSALNNADFAIPDGVGLRLAIPGLQIIKGRELFLDLIKLASEKKWKVFLLGGMNDEAAKTASKLIINNSKLIIKYDKGPRLDNNAEPVTEIDRKIEKDVVNRINLFAPHLLFVAFGNPKQEIWIHKNISGLNIKGAMAVGGTLRYVSGLATLPPRWMEQAGLEWLYRLITEPYRIGRILNAVIVFPLKVLLSRISG